MFFTQNWRLDAGSAGVFARPEGKAQGGSNDFLLAVGITFERVAGEDARAPSVKRLIYYL